MSLILQYKPLYVGNSPPPNAVKIRIAVDKSILSLPYELEAGTIINGEIVRVYEKNAEFSSMGEFSFSDSANILLPIRVKFILKSANVSQDSLYVSEDSWPQIRDYGILPEQNIIDVQLISAESDGQTIEIYPRRNVKI